MGDDPWKQLHTRILNPRTPTLGNAVTCSFGVTVLDGTKKAALLRSIALCRRVLPPEIKWINPAAVVVPIPPQHLLGNKAASWDDTVRFASYLPIHSNPRQQKDLIEAYLKANFSNENNENLHISTHIIKKIHGGHKRECFVAECSRDDGNCHVQVRYCEGSKSRVGQFVGAHYAALFGTEGTPILFLPHRTLSWLDTTESMYQQHLVGCYLTLHTNDLCACKNQALRDICDRLSMLMYLKARDKANTELRGALQEQAKHLDKYRRMFDLLTTPLRSLTEALAQTQADSQELRAILYEPNEAIFSCQPQIAELFDESKSFSFGNPEHTPSAYQDITKAKLVLAFSLARFRGKEQGTCLESETNLYQQMHDNKGHPYHELSTSLLSVLGNETWSAIGCLDLDGIKACLNTLKERFFTAYKPGESEKALRWPLLEGFLSGVTLDIANCTCDNVPLNGVAPYVVAAGANPLCTHGHLIEFICGVIDTHQRENEKASVSVAITMSQCNSTWQGVVPATAKIVRCTFTSTVDWVRPDGDSELRRIINQEIKYKKRHVRNMGEYGNFHRAFVRVVRRLPEEFAASAACTVNNGQTQLTLGDCFTVEFSGKTFSLITKRKD